MKQLITFYFVLVAAMSYASDIDLTQKKALIDLYNSTNGAQWTKQWNLSDSVEQWYGVTVENGNVTQISLPNNNLTGTIPATIGQLKSLTEINFFRNNLTGIIPAEIGTLTQLETVNLAFNQLTGIIPASISSLASLQSMELYMNRLSGFIPHNIGQLQRLQVLSLYNNDIAGTIPPSLFEIKSLQVLLLNSNRIEGLIDPQIANLTQLQKLSLFENNMIGEIPVGLGELDLQEMNISYNKFSGTTSQKLLRLDSFHMTMISDYGTTVALKVAAKNNTAVASED